MQISKSFKRIIGLAGVAVMVAAAVSCGPPPTQVGNVAKATIRGISVSKVSAQGTGETSITLSWDGIPSTAKSIKLFRREEGQGAGTATNITNLTNVSKRNFTDKDPSLKAGTKYVYNLRADDEKNAPVATAETAAMEVIAAADIKSFKLTTPAKNDDILKDPTAQGIEFSWEDAGTGLYHVQVSDLGGTILWGAVTSETKLRYGVESGANELNKPTVPRLAVPLSLSEELAVSKSTPDVTKNEVKFQGIGANTQYRILVRAIKTTPNPGDLSNATAVAIKPAEEFRFNAQ